MIKFNLYSFFLNPEVYLSICIWLFIGTGVLIISPTRELAMQTYGVAREILKYHQHTHGIIMGGARRPAEVDKLAKGNPNSSCLV